MATIDLIVLGILKKEPMSAYDIQKLVEYRNISKWVKISTPSIYKKTIQLEKKGLIKGSVVKEGKMPEKVIYSLTEDGEKTFEKLMLEKKKMCIDSIEENVKELKSYLEQNIREKENIPEIPVTGMAVLRQQFVLAEAIKTWIASVKQGFNRM